MCLAIYKPAGTKPDWHAYENGHWANDDSWGFAVVIDGKLSTACGIGKFEEFREAFEPYADRQAIIHFRYATHGQTNAANCHPFLVSGDLAVIHNGIISIKCNVNASMSDTWHFNELVLKPMHSRDPDFYKRPEIVFTQELAHDGSKFVFLRADGDFHIWNVEDGEWADDGHWYSNNTYESCSRYRYFSGGSTQTITPALKSEPAWIEQEDGKYRYEDEGGTATAELYDSYAKYLRTADREYEYEETEEDSEFNAEFQNDLRMTDLMQYGLSRQCLEEVFSVLGRCGIEALHDAL